MKAVAFILGLILLLAAGPASAGPSAEEESIKMRQRTGEIIKVDFETRRLIIKNRLGEWSFTLLPETRIKKGRNRFDRNHLVAGLKVTVFYLDDGLRVARRVEVLRGEPVRG